MSPSQDAGSVPGGLCLSLCLPVDIEDCNRLGNTCSGLDSFCPHRQCTQLNRGITVGSRPKTLCKALNHALLASGR